MAVAETVWPRSLTYLLSVPSQNNFAGPCLIQCLIPNAVWGWHLPLLPTEPLGLLNYHVSLFGSFVFDDIFSRAVLLLQRTSVHFNGVKTIPERSKKQCKLAKYQVQSRWMVWCLKRPRWSFLLCRGSQSVSSTVDHLVLPQLHLCQIHLHFSCHHSLKKYSIRVTYIGPAIWGVISNPGIIKACQRMCV